jgi:hypothetical protein
LASHAPAPSETASAARAPDAVRSTAAAPTAVETTAAPTLPDARPAQPHGAAPTPSATDRPLVPARPHSVAARPHVLSLPTAAREIASSATPAAVDDRHGPARATVASGSPQPGLLGSTSGSGSAGAPRLTFFFGLFAALAAVIAQAAQRLSRWLRLSPDLCRPPLFVSVLERPG